MKNRYKLLIGFLVLLMLSQAKAQTNNPYLSSVKWDVKIKKVGELGEYELKFKCRVKNRDFGGSGSGIDN